MKANHKSVVFGATSREKMSKGVNLLADAVKGTLGPKGKNVVIEKLNEPPHITKDGVSVAREIFLEDKLENMGAQLVKEVSSKTAEDAGDGTTTATVLAQAMINEGNRYVAAGANPMDLKRGMDKAVSKLIQELDNISTPCTARESITQVGTISANSDSTIGNLIAEAMEMVGSDGVITVEDGNGLEDSLEVVEGMEFTQGYLSPYFITDQTKQVCELNNPLILITDKSLTSARDVIPVMEAASKLSRPLLIIASEVDGEALGTLVVNNMRGVFKSCAVRAPGFGDRRGEYLSDIAAITGGVYVSDASGHSFESLKVDDFGECGSVEVSKSDFIIIDGKGTKTVIDDRINTIKEQIENCTSAYEKEQQQTRLAKISGGVAVIKVGGATEIDMKEKKDRIDDALSATRAAVEQGIVPGGGVALIRSVSALDDQEGDNYDQYLGFKVVKNALEAPLRQICDNAGVSADVVINKVLEHEDNYGFNAANEEYGDMVDMGIIDPTKVTKTALVNACSVSSLLLTTGCSISFLHEPEDVNPMM